MGAADRQASSGIARNLARAAAPRPARRLGRGPLRIRLNRVPAIPRPGWTLETAARLCGSWVQVQQPATLDLVGHNGTVEFRC